MDRHCENTQGVAEFLQEHPLVDWVSYAGLKDHPHHALAQKYMKGRASGILTFGVKGGFDAGVKFYDALKLFKRLVNIGDAKSLACHPASTTHRQLTETQQREVGVTPEAIRLSVGIEAIEDILEDLDQALSAAR
jgi:O-acetylhomoserine (thiol)-lyase